MHPMSNPDDIIIPDFLPPSDDGVFKIRAIFNLCDLYSSQKGRGVNYSSISQSYQIMFCGYTVFTDSEDFIRRFYFRDENARILDEAVGIVFVELSKLKELIKRPVDEMNSLQMWSIFLAYAADDKHASLITEIIKVKKEIAMAKELLTNISQDAIERAHFRSRRKWQMDMDHTISVTRDEGRAEGRAEGRQLERTENARRMKADGMDTSLITRYTGLSPAEINSLI